MTGIGQRYQSSNRASTTESRFKIGRDNTIKSSTRDSDSVTHGSLEHAPHFYGVSAGGGLAVERVLLSLCFFTGLFCFFSCGIMVHLRVTIRRVRRERNRALERINSPNVTGLPESIVNSLMNPTHRFDDRVRALSTPAGRNNRHLFTNTPALSSTTLMNPTHRFDDQLRALSTSAGWNNRHLITNTQSLPSTVASPAQLLSHATAMHVLTPVGISDPIPRSNLEMTSFKRRPDSGELFNEDIVPITQVEQADVLEMEGISDNLARINRTLGLTPPRGRLLAATPASPPVEPGPELLRAVSPPPAPPPIRGAVGGKPLGAYTL